MKPLAEYLNPKTSAKDLSTSYKSSAESFRCTVGYLKFRYHRGCSNQPRQRSDKIVEIDVLRYYATFKVSKLESLFYKFNTFLQKTTTCIGLQAEQTFSVNI